MKQKLLNWILWHVYGYDPKVQKFLVQMAKKCGLNKKEYSSLIGQMTDQELADFRFILQGCSEPDEDWGGMKVFYSTPLSKDKRAQELLDAVEKKQEQRRKQAKKEKFAALDWNRVVIDENSFELSCKKSEFGAWGKARFDVRAQQDNGFPSHILSYTASAKLGEEEVVLDNERHECSVNISTNEEETKWLKKHRVIVSFNPYETEEPEPLFQDDYHQQKYDKPRPLPIDTKQRIKDFLCGQEDENPEKNQFENFELIKPILQVLVYNHLLQRKLELDKLYVAERIKKEHLKEKMRYRLKYQYSKCKF